MSRPPAVRIDDLAAPRFPEEMRPMLDGMAAMAEQVSFESEALMQLAVDQTGLTDFGDPGFRERLDVLATAMRTEGRHGPLGKLTVGGMLVQCLRNRLLVEDLIKRHPEIERIQIARPIIVCGLPRTGTTHLHNLIAADPALRSLPYWESLEP
ncbi:MAG: sulfotransferase, partial [Actinomycetota bacterium]